MKKLAIYSIVSLAVMAVVIASSFHTHQQYYPAMVHLAQSRLFNVLLSNSFMVIVSLGFQLVRYIFLGNLRVQEVEKVMENTAFFLMEIFLTLTIFSEKFTVMMVALFVLCVVWKIFHWLGQSRLEFIEQTPTVGAGQLRLVLFLFTLIFVDGLSGLYFVNDMATNGPSVRLIILEEFVIMSILASTSLLRLLVHFIDARRNRRWEGKGSVRFYLEIVSDVLQCGTYILFFFVIYSYYGLPINLLREMFVTVRNLYRTSHNFMNYRRLAANLDEQFRDATEEEVEQDPTCSICYDELYCGDAKKLGCSHMFHRHCLRQWLERQTTCPYCRQNIDTTNAANAAREAQQARDAAAAAAAAQVQNPPADNVAGGVADNINVNNNSSNNNATQQPQTDTTAAATPKLPTTATITPEEIAEAYSVYQGSYMLVKRAAENASATAAAAASTSSSSSSSEQPVTQQEPCPRTGLSSPAVSTPVPIPSMSLMSRSTSNLCAPSVEEAAAYIEFHQSMVTAYSDLHKRLSAQRAADPQASTSSAVPGS
eukprot:TRINITY_DN790_c7_g1_i1.p1 TRINITY_DN790_c7_g1~~TRINITY_DN790_c7_g1_i1.p1  ORF type:complete len:561 (+),score=98.91 TRINITY_DN790_c7_g1_i1:69-1685(+)